MLIDFYVREGLVKVSFEIEELLGLYRTQKKSIRRNSMDLRAGREKLEAVSRGRLEEGAVVTE